MKQHNARFLSLVADAKKRVRETNVQEIKQKIDRGDTFFLVDVREQDEWQRGHLPTAIYLGKGIIERDIEKVIPDENAEIVVYCGGGFRSALTADTLQRMGYKNVISMNGGFRGWVDAGFPIEK